MGYTHYLEFKKTYTDDQWTDFVNTAKRLYHALPANTDTAGGCYLDQPLSICGGYGNGEPVIGQPTEWSNGEPVVWFNGDEKDGMDHETFCIVKNKKEWSFCKTARKPYDLLVCAILLAARDYLGAEVGSDGDIEDWMPAIRFYLETEYSEMPDLKDILPEKFKDLELELENINFEA